MSYPVGIPERVRVSNTVEFTIRCYDTAGNELTSGSSYTAYWVLSNSTTQMSATTQTQTDQGFLFQVATSGWTSGDYTSVVYADNGSLRYEQELGSVEVLPSLDSAVEGRSTARQILDAINSAILGQATTNQLSMSVAGRSIQRMSMTELIEAKGQFESLVKSEENTEDMKNGKASKNTVKTRFTRG